MRTLRTFAALVALLFGLSAQNFLVQAGEIKKTFQGVKEVRIKTVSGNCVIEKGSSPEVAVTLTYSYDDEDYEPELEQRGDRLLLTEQFFGRHVTGKSTWRLTAPEKIAITFSTASGDFEAADLTSLLKANTASGNVRLRNLKGEFDINTASGEIDAQKLEGRIEMNTASGDITLASVSTELDINTASGRIDAQDLKGKVKINSASGNISISTASGEFEINAASGDIAARGVIIEQASILKAASGDVEVTLGKNLSNDLSLHSASGDAVLNFNNHPVVGFIKMTAKVRSGSIRAPFEFDEEDTYYRGDDEYVTKTVKKGSDTPIIEIRTASGDAVLLEK